MKLSLLIPFLALATSACADPHFSRIDIDGRPFGIATLTITDGQVAIVQVLSRDSDDRVMSTTLRSRNTGIADVATSQAGGFALYGNAPGETTLDAYADGELVASAPIIVAK